MKRTIQQLLMMPALALLLHSPVSGQVLHLDNAGILMVDKGKSRISTHVEMFREEVERRTAISIPVVKNLKRRTEQLIVVCLTQDMEQLPAAYREQLEDMPDAGPEGFRLAVVPAQQAVLVAGSDERGVLYGLGRLLRKLEMRPGNILVPEGLSISTTPRYPIRGHQLGYRPKTNSYDAWSVEQYDQYIRELTIFGTNSIEIMPPRTDDDFSSVHMQIPAIEMIVEQSRICNKYGLDVWMWYPNMGSDYSHPDSIASELQERHAVFGSVERLDDLFVPGGDPGDVEPDVLFDWLEMVAEVLHEYHPTAKIWVSPQVFRPTKAWFDVFYDRVNKGYPWFGGIVFGPWVKTPIEQIRKIVRPDIPIRRYPDITHSLSSQYPVPKWDLAQAMTLGRECINPRPNDEKAIHNALDEYAEGSLSYSEGTNDDVNKFVWSDQDWDPETPVIETLRDYARVFIGPDYAEDVAQGLLALERNMQGPLLENDGVDLALWQWQKMEERASEEILDNFRFQMGLIRAYFDAYIRGRFIREHALEQEARAVLAAARQLGTREAIGRAGQILDMAASNPAYQQYKDRCLELADALYESVGAQLTVKKHNAMSGRGNFIDNLDVPLNDAVWLKFMMREVQQLSSEEEKLEAIEKMLHRTDPGPGGFYDNFGSLNSWDRVEVRYDEGADPGDLKTPRVSFGVGLIGREWVHEITATGFEGRPTPLAWMNQVTTLYDTPLEITYDNLNPAESYTLRVSYTGRFRSRMKLMADGILVHDFIKTGMQPTYEFPIPAEALEDGTVTFSWTCGEGERGSQVAEIWIIREGK
jgi:hypothetical protein